MNCLKREGFFAKNQNLRSKTILIFSMTCGFGNGKFAKWSE